jgi:hypothetical protein
VSAGAGENKNPGAVTGTGGADEAQGESSIIFAGIKECPTSGQGVHQWCFYAYNTLRERGVTHDEAARYCETHATRTLTRGDIPNGPAGVKVALRKPRGAYNPERLQRVAAKAAGFGMDDIKKRSPLDPGQQTPATTLRHLYRPGEKVLLFDKCESQGQIIWQAPREGDPYNEHVFDRFLKPARGEGAWLLANSITGQWVKVSRLVSTHNPEGRTRRAVEALASCRYCVVESDAAPQDQWLRALVQMPLPIAAVTSSGGKSIHALIDTGAKNLEEWHEAADIVARVVIPLGADPATLNTPAQLTRMPGFYRGTKGKWQELLYLNPAADSTPIIARPERGEP